MSEPAAVPHSNGYGESQCHTCPSGAAPTGLCNEQNRRGLTHVDVELLSQALRIEAGEIQDIEDVRGGYREARVDRPRGVRRVRRDLLARGSSGHERQQR